MAIEFSCPTCRETLRVEDEAAGRQIRCGGCLSMLRVPDAAPPSFLEPDPEPEPEPDEYTAAAPPRPSSPSPLDARRPHRRPLPPPPPSGRNPLFWIMMTMGILTLGSCVCCCGIIALLPEPKWQDHESEKGGFKVELPAPPRDDMAQRIRSKTKGNDKAGRTVEGTVFTSRGEQCAISYWGWQPAQRREMGDDQFLDQMVAKIVADANARLSEPAREIEAANFPAREFQFRDKSGNQHVARLILADRRFYLLEVSGRFVEPDRDNVQRFFDSFEITDPKILAVIEKRAELAHPANWKRDQERREELWNVQDAGEAVGAAIAEILDAPGK
jgi:hypothetical protein